MRRMITIRRTTASFLTLLFCISATLPVWAENDLITKEDPASSSVTSLEETSSDSINSSIEVILPASSETSSKTQSVGENTGLSSDLDSNNTTQSNHETSSNNTVESTADSDQDTIPSSASVITSSKQTTSSKYTVPAPTISPEWNDKLNTLYNNACDWLKQRDNSELFFLAMGCSGKSIDSKQYGTFLSTVSESTYTELYPLALTAINATFCGIQATNINGIDLIDQIADFPNLQEEDAKALGYALLALNSNPYEVSPEAKNSRKSLVEALLKLQKENGSFLADNDDNALSFTAIALTALADYNDLSSVRESLNKGLGYLQAEYQKTRFQNESSIVLSQIITALTCLKININDSRFTRNNKNLCDQLLGYIGNDSGFRQAKTDEISDPLSTEAAIVALTAIKYFTSPYVTRQSLAESVSSVSDSGNGLGNFYWSWWLLLPIGLVVIGLCLAGVLLYKKKTQSKQDDSTEKENE